MAGVVHVPWYVTLFRGDQFEHAIQEIAPVALRYGASEYSVYRSRDDAYKFLQLATFESKPEFERYWYGEDFSLWRAEYSGWYQVPVLYVWHDMLMRGGVGELVTSAPAAPSRGQRR